MQILGDKTENHHPTPTNTTHAPKEPTKEHNIPNTTEYRHPHITAITFNTRGMHNTILDLNNIMNTKKKPTIIHLTETKHSHIKSIWRVALKDYKLIHTHPILDPSQIEGREEPF